MQVYTQAYTFIHTQIVSITQGKHPGQSLRQRLATGAAPVSAAGRAAGSARSMAAARLGHSGGVREKEKSMASTSNHKWTDSGE